MGVQQSGKWEKIKFSPNQIFPICKIYGRHFVKKDVEKHECKLIFSVNQFVALFYIYFPFWRETGTGTNTITRISRVSRIGLSGYQEWGSNLGRPINPEIKLVLLLVQFIFFPHCFHSNELRVWECVGVKTFCLDTFYTALWLCLFQSLFLLFWFEIFEFYFVIFHFHW